jgi:hypothetical protein
MKVSGFSFIRNAVKFDYPIVEAILSVLPLCDEFILAVGDSEDATRDLINGISSSKLKLVHTTWDDSLREGGRVLAEETNKAFRAIQRESDWCFYIQGDEILHEKYHETVQKAMADNLDERHIDGLLFKYLHFYGSYDYIGTSSRWYRNEIRIVRNNPSIYSFRDAQGFRKGDNKMLTVKQLDAYIYHYGWVKPPSSMQAKQRSFQKLWHPDDWVEKKVAKADEFDYSEIDRLEFFSGTHPEVMQKRITQANWKFDHDISKNRITLKERAKEWVFLCFGWDLNYKNYILAKD